MKIALVSQAYPPMVSGASIFVQNLATGLAGRGHEILVLAASESGLPTASRQGGLTVVRLKSSPNPLRANQHYVTWAYRRLHTQLAEFRPDVLHLHDATTLGLASMLAGRKLGIPAVLTAHQLPWFVVSYMPDLPALKLTVERVLWDYCRWLDNNLQAMISPTKTIAGTIEQFAGVEPVVIANGIDLDRYSPEPAEQGERERLLRAYGLDPDRPIILHVGRLDVEKQADLVVQAAADVMRQSDAQLLVAGDGRQRDSLVALAEQLGIGASAHFPGFVSAAGDLAGVYRLADVFVTASEIEIQPLVLLEALASGLPVVAVRATSIPEVVIEGVNGHLVPPKDTAAMAARILDLLGDPSRARQMGLHGRSLALEYSIDSSVTKHEALYARLAAHGWNPAGQGGTRQLRKIIDRFRDGMQDRNA